MGGGPKIVGNPENIKEADAELSSRIRPIEFIKHNPQLFHMNFFDVSQQYEILGGYKTLAMQLLGGVMAWGGPREQPERSASHPRISGLRRSLQRLAKGASVLDPTGERTELHDGFGRHEGLS